MPEARSSRPDPDQNADSSPIAWATLLSRWMEFARAAVAFPDDAEGERWKRSVAPVIGLQAVTFALGELERVPEAERAVALDRAEVLIRTHRADLEKVWEGEAMHPELIGLIEDAQTALARRRC